MKRLKKLLPWIIGGSIGLTIFWRVLDKSDILELPYELKSLINGVILGIIIFYKLSDNSIKEDL